MINRAQILQQRLMTDHPETKFAEVPPSRAGWRFGTVAGDPDTLRLAVHVPTVLLASAAADLDDQEFDLLCDSLGSLIDAVDNLTDEGDALLWEGLDTLADARNWMHIHRPDHEEMIARLWDVVGLPFS
jgi:hypothetical protein